MKLNFKYYLLISFFYALQIQCLSAGTLVHGVWKPASCGELPEVPKVDDNDVEHFNQSMNTLNDWQLKANRYYECIVEEANADNKIIAEQANQAQKNYKDLLSNINRLIATDIKKLEEQQ